MVPNWLFENEMDEKKYNELFRYLTENDYSERSEKKRKKVFRRSCQNFFGHEVRLYFKELEGGKSDIGSESQPAAIRLVIKGEDERNRVFSECHQADYGGHVGRENTLAIIKTTLTWYVSV